MVGEAAAKIFKPGNADERWRADGAVSVELPNSASARCTVFAGTTFRESVAFTNVVGRQVRQIVLLGARPERSNPRKPGINGIRGDKAIVRIVWCVFDAAVEFSPKVKSVWTTRDLFSRPHRVAEREVEPGEHAASVAKAKRNLRFQKRHRVVAGLLEMGGLRLVLGNTDPDRVRNRVFGRGNCRRRPVHNDHRIEPSHNPTSPAMKSAIARVSSRSNTGRPCPSRGVSEAMARIVSSPGAMSGLPVSARWASTLG